MKKVGLVSGLAFISLVAVACNNTDETDSANEATPNVNENISETEPIENEEGNGSNDQQMENVDESSGDSTGDSQSGQTELSEDEAIERVKEYAEENKEYDPEHYEFMVDDDEEKYNVSLIPYIPDDEQRGAQIIGRFEVDKSTGDVEEDAEETNDDEASDDELKTSDNPHMSELIDYSSDELLAFNEGIITHSGGKVEGQEPPQHFLEELMLPGVHENTEVYEGFAGLYEMSSEEGEDQEPRTVSIYLNDYNPDEMDPIATPSVDEDGYFVADFTEVDITEGDTLYISVQAPDLANQAVAGVEVAEPSEEMEHIYLR